MNTEHLSKFHSEIPPLLHKIHTKLKKNGFQSYIVGGAVRDILLGRSVLDWDMNTNARPEEMQQIFPHAIPTGIKHGTITIKNKEASCELTSFRLEGDYSDKRRPDIVDFNAKLVDDLSRRDFTVNTLAYDIEKGAIIDPFDGQTEIRSKIIRCVGDPEQRMLEDYLRMLRALRFASQLSFRIEDRLLQCIRAHAHKVTAVSRERITVELQKLISTHSVSQGMQYAAQTTIFAHIFHDDAFKMSQKTAHQIGTVLSLAWKRHAEKNIQWALFFLLCYKHQKRLHPRYRQGNIYKLSHWMHCLRFSKRETRTIRNLVNAAHFTPRHSWSDANLRFYRAYAQVDSSVLLSAVLLCCYPRFSRLEKRFHAALDSYIPRSKLAINGKALIVQLHCKPGKNLGVLLHCLYRYVLHYPEKNSAEHLLARARMLSHRR